MNSPGNKRRKNRQAAAPARKAAPAGGQIRPLRPRPRLLILSIALFCLWLIVLITLAADALYGVSGASSPAIR